MELAQKANNDSAKNDMNKTKEMDFRTNQFQFHLETHKQNIKKISASRLQKYLECPQKYYLNSVEKINPMIQFETELSVLELGQIQHKVIELYFESESTFQVEAHEDIINRTLSSYIKDRDIPVFMREEYFIEVKTYTQKAIEVIIDFTKYCVLRQTGEQQELYAESLPTWFAIWINTIKGKMATVSKRSGETIKVFGNKVDVTEIEF